MEKLPDQLQPHLRLVFVGTAASRRSADTGHYYAHPGNRFWRTLHEVGITPRRYAPREFPALLDLGIGFTDLCKTGAGTDHEALAFPVDIAGFTYDPISLLEHFLERRLRPRQSLVREGDGAPDPPNRLHHRHFSAMVLAFFSKMLDSRRISGCMI